MRMRILENIPTFRGALLDGDLSNVYTIHICMHCTLDGNKLDDLLVSLAATVQFVTCVAVVLIITLSLSHLALARAYDSIS